MKRSKKWLPVVLCLLMLAVLPTSFVKADGAVALAVNTSVTDVCEDGVAKVYQVIVPSTGKFNAQLSHENLFTTEAYWAVQVLAADLQTVLQEYTSIGTDDVKSGASLGLTAGTYYIKVISDSGCGSGLEYSDKPYTLTPVFQPSDSWEVEYDSVSKSGNDFQGAATTIPAGKRMYGSICKNDDVDFFKFQMKKKGYVQIQFTHPNVYIAENCWKVQLVNSKTGVIHEVDSLGTKASLTTQQIGLSAGTYYIKVIKGDELSDADYAVTVKAKASKQWEEEYSTKTNKDNNNQSRANTLTWNKAMSGVITKQQDVDFYKVKVKSNKNVRFTLSHKYKAKRAKYWRVTVYNSKLKQVCTFESRGIDKSMTKRVNLKAGTYFVKVEAAKKWNKDVYKIKVN